MSVLGIKNNKLTLSSVGVIPCAMFGGTPANPIASTMTNLALSSSTSYAFTFAIDSTKTYAYGNFSAGLARVSLASGVVTTFVTQALLSVSAAANAVDVAISDDGTTLYVLTNTYRLVSINIASGAVTPLIGTGATGTTDGTGTSAAISGNSANFLLPQNAPLNGVLYILDSGKFRTFTIATGTIATISSIPSVYTGVFSASDSFYTGLNGECTAYAFNLTTGIGVATALPIVPGYTTGNRDWSPDLRSPQERCVYGISNVDAKLWRYDLQTSTWTNIATLPAIPSETIPRRSFIWVGNTKLYISVPGYLTILS